MHEHDGARGTAVSSRLELTRAKRAAADVVLSPGSFVTALVALLCAVGVALAGLAGALPVWIAALITVVGLISLAVLAALSGTRGGPALARMRRHAVWVGATTSLDRRHTSDHE